MQWKLNPQAIKGVLEKVQSQAEDMSKDIEKRDFEDIAQAITGGGGGLMQEVPAAVTGLVKDQGKNFDDIGKHVRAGLAGVTSATIAYNNAQTSMSDEMNKYNLAENFQIQMFKSAETGDMSYFEQNAPK